LRAVPSTHFHAVLRTTPPPYSLETPSFRFPALAALAGRLPLGSGRETALAVLLSARVAEGALTPGLLSASVRKARGAAAHQWLAATCPDAKVRAACTALVEAAATGDRAAIGKAVTRVMDVTAGHLDAAARSELRQLTGG
jgi:hypothetical protein